jgi:hypothetical protein
MRGWFEDYDDTFRGNAIDSKVIDYCKFRDTDAALTKDLGDEYILFKPKS